MSARYEKLDENSFREVRTITQEYSVRYTMEQIEAKIKELEMQLSEWKSLEMKAKEIGFIRNKRN